MDTSSHFSGYDWALHEYPDPADVQTLRTRLGAYNIARASIDQGMTLAIFVRDQSGEMIAGVYGWLWGACLELDYLWVQDDLRGKGIGKELVHRLEVASAERGCRQITLDTYSFQAPEFYRKLGYEVFGVIDGYAGGHRKFFMHKRLRAA